MKIGILGGGQLARMLALTAYPLGIEVVCVEPNQDCPAKKVTPVIHSDFSKTETIIKHFTQLDCVTFETENLPIEAIEKIAEHSLLRPSLQALKITQDRYLEKSFLNSLDIPTTPYVTIENWESLASSLKLFHYPAILKTRKNGYDGKGQKVISNEGDAKKAWSVMQRTSLILEKFIVFDCEVSVIAVRNQEGLMVFYPLVLNQHKNGILYISRAPYSNPIHTLQAQKYAKQIMEKLNYVGVMTIEFFCKDSNLIVNEIAPRVHNSGHWTIEGSETSQFENHLRAICGLPLGSTRQKNPVAMINLIGNRPDVGILLNILGLHYHWYDKIVLPNRKLGHLTLCAENENQLQKNINKALQVINTNYIED